MIKKQALRIVLGVLVIISLAAVAQAEVYKLAFYVWSQRNPNPPDQICFQINIADTQYRVPYAIKSLKVLAPDNTEFDLTTGFGHEWMNQFWASFNATNFISQTIPAGTYKCTLIDKTGKTKTASETFTPAFLDPSTITSPVNNTTVPSLTPTFTWTAVTGAKLYRVYLFNESWKEPVYCPTLDGHGTLYVNQTRFIVPLGVLRPKSTYSLRVEARDSDKYLKKRSRSTWVTFSTP